MSTFVFLPGAGSGPDHWRLVEALLQDAGHDTVAPDLPNEDDAAGLPEYTAAAIAAIGNRQDLMLVGQSLGAFTAASVAAEQGAELIVYLNGMIPIEGETPGEWWGNVGHEAAAAEILAAHGPLSTWTQPDFEVVFLHDVPPENLAIETPRRQGGGVFGTPLTRYPSEIPARAIGGSRDRLFPIEFQKDLARQRLGIELDVVESGHLTALANPEGLATQLLAYVDEI
ncbi:MAG: alpha/beta fold hydrolase [Solirubrobacterales bacterium]